MSTPNPNSSKIRSADIQAVFPAMAQKRVLIVGDPMLDTYLFGETVRISREAPVPVVRKEGAEHRLGGAANTAANLAALGVQVTFLAPLGSNQTAENLRRLLVAAGIKEDALLASDVVNAVKTRVLAGAFGTARQQVLRVDEDPSGFAHEGLKADVLKCFQKHAQDADVIILSDYGHGTVNSAVIAHARELVREGLPVCVDSRFRLTEFLGMSAITPNIPEAEGVVGFPIQDQAGAERAGPMLQERLQAESVLLTQGRQGMTLFEGSAAPAHVDIVGDEEVTDVTGAGDTVIATFAACLAAGVGMQNAMRLANLAAGIVVGRVGCATARPQEILSAAKEVGLELLPWQ